MAKFPMAGGRSDVPILFSKSQAKNNPECFFLHRANRADRVAEIAPEHLSRNWQRWNKNKIRGLTGIHRGVRCMGLVESRRPVVLIVEDEFLLRMDAVDMIAAAGFEVVEAANADDAIEILESRPDITAVFTDVQMPGTMDGLKLARAVRGRWPPVKIIATSGHVPFRETDLPEGGRFLPKPYSPRQVTGVLRELMSSGEI
jgi:CheY-like chemotaxis protein